MKKHLYKKLKLQHSLMLIPLATSACALHHPNIPENLCNRKPVSMLAEDIGKLSTYALDNYYEDLMLWLEKCDNAEYKRLMKIQSHQK